MHRLLASLAVLALTASAQQPFTLQQILSAPYSTNLTASPVGARFAWVEDVEGRHNLWVGGPSEPARQLTHYTEDDAQDIAGLAWSPDGNTIAYVYGAETGNSGRPANPAHLQRPTAVEIYLQPIAGGEPIRIGEGHAPLFTPDGKSLLFLRSGQIFIADLAALKACTANKDCHPERAQRVEGPAQAPTPENPSNPFNHPLLYDRGTASQLALSPDGTKLAYISRRRTDSYLALYNLVTKELTFPAPSTGNDSAPLFSRDGKQLAWLRFPFTDPSEFSGARTSPNPWSIQLLTLSTNETRTLFSPEPNKPGSLEPRLATGEPHLLWGLNPTIHLIVQSQPLQSPSTASRGLQQVSFVQKQMPSVTDAPPREFTQWLLFFSEADGYVHLYGLDPSDPKPKPIPYNEGRYEVEDAMVSPDGHMVYYSSNQNTDDHSLNDSGYHPLDQDRRHIYAEYVEPYFGGVGPIRITSGTGIETHPALSADGHWMASLVASPTLPMHVEFVERQKVWAPSGSLQPKVVKAIPAHPLPDSKQYPAAELITPTQVIFPSSDNLFQLHGQLFLPKPPAAATGKRPAILFFHGGPKRQMLLGYPSMDYYSNAYAMNQYLASRGYIVLSVNYRGGIGYGLDFRQCQHCGADGAAEYADALGAAAYLRSRPDVDTAHIGIWGGSYGGYFVALALARNSDIFAAGVDFHGVHEWAREDNAAADWLRGSLAEQEKIAAVAHASSPMADVAKWRSPVLLIHGDDDPEVAYTQTPMLADALRARGVHVEELIFPDELHGFVLHRDWLAAYQAAADFFERTLKPATPLK
jgi:dipeptidyl aminopeptidase/acylaminoacyl peptidase